MATKWNLDPAHSEITFKVKHMMISNVKGQFKSFFAEIESEDDTFKNVKTTATIQTDSVDTNLSLIHILNIQLQDIFYWHQNLWVE